jgi:urate oxidase
MELKNFIKVYDNVLDLNVLSNILKTINSKGIFEKASVGGGHTIDFNIRRTYVIGLDNMKDSLTLVHWNNYLNTFFKQYATNYSREFNSYDPIINDIQILKYESGGFYKWHTDHFTETPRTLSMILFLNNDYEGGSLNFKNPDNSGEHEIKPTANRLVVWPSNFLYPHRASPVTKGVRYTVVAWAL